MPSYIIKGDPRRDEYVYWSTVVEAPTFWGTGQEMLEHLMRPFRDDDPERYHFELQQVRKRLDRADEFGTSCKDLGDGLRFYDWSSDSVIYEQEGMVRRGDLWALCQRLNRGESVADLLMPFDQGETRTETDNG